MEKRESISKQALRSKYLGCRNSLSAGERKEKSAAIWGLLKQEEVYQKAQIVLAYMDYRSEVMTTGLVEEILSAGEKRVFVPKVEGMNIQFYEITSLDDLLDGYQGIREPSGDKEKLFTEEVSRGADCLILVPGAVFDRERGRMGYGKGFYDRYLAAFPALTSVSPAFSCQIARKVPVEEHDKRPDMVITETEVIR